MSFFTVDPASLNGLAENLWTVSSGMGRFALPVQDYAGCGDPTVAEYLSDFGATMREATGNIQTKAEILVGDLQAGARHYAATEAAAVPATGP